MRAGVYGIFRGDICLYVGSTVNLKKRAQRHRRDILRNKHHNKPLQRAVKKYGVGAFAFEVLYLCEPDKCEMYEQIFIDMLKPEYNLCPVVGNMLGYTHTDQARANMSAAQLGNTNNLGKKLTEEHKAKISAANLGKKLSDETKAKLRAANLGKTPTEEHIAKILAARLGYKHSEETKAKLRVAGKRYINTIAGYIGSRKGACSKHHKDIPKIDGLCEQCWAAMDPAMLAKLNAEQWLARFGQYRQMFSTAAAGGDA